MFDKTTGYDSGLIFARGKLILIINFEGNMKKILGFLALGVFAGTVNATIIDFESGSISSGGIYTEDGFNLTVNNYFGGNAAIQTSTNPGNATNIFAFCSVDGSCGDDGTSLSLDDSSAFSISSIDAANWQFEGTTGEIDLIGNFFGGGSITQTITTSDVWSSFSLSGFNNLSSLDIIGSSVYAVDIDNLNINAASVPEPASLVLMGLGLAGIGFSRKNKAA
jgi:hypothetical protein